MRLHYLQHVFFESPGSILDWAEENNVEISSTHFFEKNSVLPNQDDFDCLVVMGGPMGVYDLKDYPWLEEELTFIKDTIARNKPILGICLGAQLIASALGAKVFKGTKEIGWYPVQKQNSGYYFKEFPEEQIVFHWHGDTFELPNNATLIASSSVTKNQAFEINNVVGLQFHFEMGEDNILKILENAADDLTNDPYVQTKEIIASTKDYYEENERILFNLLDKLFGL